MRRQPGLGKGHEMYAQVTTMMASEHRRGMLADAKRRRPGQLQLALLRASRRAGRAEWRMHRAYRTAARLRTEL
jgi:hypothetical protein